MTNVIQLVRYVEISEDAEGLFAQEISTHGLNKPNETYEEYTMRMAYHECSLSPNYPVPAIRYEVVFPWEDAGYVDMIYVNDMGREDDPDLVACWDWDDTQGKWRGIYQACYIDVRADWYRQHGAWRADND